MSKRRISVIFQLLHGRSLRKQEIEHKINHDSFLDDAEKVDDAKLSHVLTELYKDDIITKTSIISEGKGAPQITCQLKRTPLALIKVLAEFSDPKLEKKGYFQRHFIISPYAQSNINMKLIKFIESNIRNEIKDRLNVTNFRFNTKENKLLLNIFRTSPSALYYATVDYNITIERIIETRKQQLERVDKSNQDEMKNKIIGIIKRSFYLNLQLNLGEDLNKNIIKFDGAVEYRISLKFLDDIKTDQYWKLFCKNNAVETIFLRDKY